MEGTAAPRERRDTFQPKSKDMPDSTLPLTQTSLSSFDGPPVPTSYASQQHLTIDEQLGDAAERLQHAKAFALASPDPGATAKPVAIPPSWWDRNPPAVAKNNLAVFTLEADEEYKEMGAWLEELNARQIKGEPVTSWKEGVRTSLERLLGQVRLSTDPHETESHLRRVYQWFLGHRKSPKARSAAGVAPSGPDFSKFFEEEAAEGRMPGSAFYNARDILDEDEEHESTAGISIAPHVNGMPLGLPDRAPAQLPPARDRLKEFQTRQVVSPLAFRRHVASPNAAYQESSCSSRPESPKDCQRPFTPSTATGGLTSRSSAMSSRCTSAMSSRPASSLRPSSGALGRPTPRPQRPSSALVTSQEVPPGNETHRFSCATPPQRPRTAGAASRYNTQGLGQATQACLRPRQTPQQAAQVAPRELTEAEQDMEKRWLAHRHREVTNQIVAEDRRAAIGVWSERRARVEEEVSRNAEAIRYQSMLQQRGYVMPESAGDDIPATGTARGAPSSGGIEPPERPRPSSRQSPASPARLAKLSRLAAAAAQRPESALAALGAAASGSGGGPPRYDVSRVEALEQRETIVKFQKIAIPRKEHISDRVAHLRKIHAHLLEVPEEPEGEDADEEANNEAAPVSIFDMGDGEEYLSLSAYTGGGGLAQDVAVPGRDNDDVLVGVCDSWRRHPGAGGQADPQDSALDEIRFQQMQEAQAVTRAMARRNVPVDTAAVEAGLVMPQHRVRELGHDVLFNTESRFGSGTAQKKKKKGRQKSGSPGPRRSKPSLAKPRAKSKR